MSPPYTGALATGTTIFIAADLAYLYLRPRLVDDDLSRRGRVIAAAVVAVAASLVGWVGYPLLFEPEWHGLAGVYMYGLLAIPITVAIHLLNRPLVPPIGAGGVVSIAIVLVLMLVNGVLPTVPGEVVSDLLTLPLILGTGLGVFVGVYVADWYMYADLDADDEPERELIGPAGGFDGPIEWSPNSDNASANNAVVEQNATNGRPNHSTNKNRTQTQRHNHGSGSGSLGQPGSGPESASGSALPSAMYDWERSTTTFDDIGGYYDVKNALHEGVLEPLLAARTGDDRFSRFGVEPERGILLYGPPGTGKTMFMRALAGELDVPFVELSPADVTSMWVNESSDHVKTLFDEASDLGECIIFLDEAEHLFGAREHTAKSAHAEDRKVTSEFLAQLTREDRRAIVVAATNRPGDIDRAILRPGRLTAHFEVGVPDEEARHAILSVHLKDIPSSLSGNEYAEIATHTGGLTGAGLVSLVGQARRRAARRNARAVMREDFPSNVDLEELAASLTPETDDPPDVDAGRDGSESDLEGERRSSPETATRGGAKSDEPDNDPALGYQ